MTAINNALIFTINTCFELYAYILMLRLMLPMVRADFHNPLSQLTLTLTNVLVKPLAKLIPKVSHLNLSVLLILLVINGIKLFLNILLQYHIMASPLGLFLWNIGDLISLGIKLMFMLTIVLVVSSWVSQQRLHPILNMIYRIVDPYLLLFRRFIPPIAGLDLSPMVALLALQLLDMLLASPIKGVALRLL